ncbi:hypothetical protein Bca4012_062950 [Brassica carinata]
MILFSHFFLILLLFFFIFLAGISITVTDCGSVDPELKLEMEKLFVDLLAKS